MTETPHRFTKSAIDELNRDPDRLPTRTFALLMLGLIDRPSPVPSPAGLVVKTGLNSFSPEPQAECSAICARRHSRLAAFVDGLERQIQPACARPARHVRETSRRCVVHISPIRKA